MHAAKMVGITKRKEQELKKERKKARGDEGRLAFFENKARQGGKKGANSPDSGRVREDKGHQALLLRGSKVNGHAQRAQHAHDP